MICIVIYVVQLAIFLPRFNLAKEFRIDQLMKDFSPKVACLIVSHNKMDIKLITPIT